MITNLPAKNGLPEPLVNKDIIHHSVVDSLQNPRFITWMLIRSLSAFGPIVVTYLFSEGIRSLENHQSIDHTLQIFFLMFVVGLVENIVRLLSKTRLIYLTESIQMNIQQRLIKVIKPNSSNAKEQVQGILNITQSVGLLIDDIRQNGMNGIISFITIPIIMFCQDKKMFVLLCLMILFYFLVNYPFSKSYERTFERYTLAREAYFAELFSIKKNQKYVNRVLKYIKEVSNVTFIGWISLQNVVVFFQFVIVLFLAMDVFHGTKQISDLILIFGYTRESQVFLNQVSSVWERFMEVKASNESLSETMCS